jgi:hypothetical protein
MKKVIFAALMAIASIAHADPYMTLGAGVTLSPAKPVATIGAGYQLNSWLAVEADYRYLNTISGGNGEYLGDNTWTYNPVTFVGHCATTPCHNSTGFGKSTTQGFGLSAVAKKQLGTDGEHFVFVRAGVLRGTSKYESHFEPAYATTTVTDTRTKYSPMFGVGMEVGHVAVELTHYQGVVLFEGAYQSTTTATLSYKLPL